MRRLTLHASALSDAEYDFFTNSLREIADGATNSADDACFEEMSIGIREARAWLRGRYSHIPISILDGILEFFSPNLGKEDVINGNEFFAVLRLVCHAENGREIDRALAFVQVYPLSRKQSNSPSPSVREGEFTSPRPKTNDLSTLSTNSIIKNAFISQQIQPTDLARHSPGNPFILPNQYNTSHDSKFPPLPPRRPSSSSMSTNSYPHPPPPRHVASSRIERSISPAKRQVNTPPIPPKPSQHVTSTLIKQSLQARKIAQSMKKAEDQLDKERVLQVLKSSSIVTGTNIHNQHQHHHPNASASAKGLHSLALSTSSSSDGGQRSKVPPLPKRHTPSQQPSPPLSDCSLEQVALASSDPHPESLTAAASHSVRNTQSRTSNPFNKEDHANNSLPAPPPTHPDRNPTYGYKQLEASPKPMFDSLPAQNLATFEAIYGPVGSQSISPFSNPAEGRSPGDHITSVPNLDSIVTTNTPTRSFRSQSLSHEPISTSPLPLPPPLRVKRPETIQVVRNVDSMSNSVSRRTSLGGGHKKSSLSLSSTSSFQSHASSPFTDDNAMHRWTSGTSTNSEGGQNTASGVVGNNIQRTIDALSYIHGQIQPKLEKARYKAEAGFSKRGYVRSAVRSSADDESRRAEKSEQEGLTWGYDSSQRTRGRWEQPSHIDESQARVDDEGSGESEGSELGRGRATFTERIGPH